MPSQPAGRHPHSSRSCVAAWRLARASRRIALLAWLPPGFILFCFGPRWHGWHVTSYQRAFTGQRTALPSHAVQCNAVLELGCCLSCRGFCCCLGSTLVLWLRLLLLLLVSLGCALTCRLFCLLLLLPLLRGSPAW